MVIVWQWWWWWCGKCIGHEFLVSDGNPLMATTTNGFYWSFSILILPLPCASFWVVISPFFFLNLWRSNIGHKMALEKNSFDHPAQFQYLAFITLQHSAIRDEPQMFVSFLVVSGNIHIWISRRVTSRFFDRLNSMIYDLKRSVDPRWLFDPVLHSSFDDLVLLPHATLS